MASVWSADAGAALAVACRLEAGTVWINEIQHLTSSVTFGGLKASGIGSENGIEGLLAFTAPQAITVTPGIAWLSSMPDPSSCGR